MEIDGKNNGVYVDFEFKIDLIVWKFPLMVSTSTSSASLK